MKTSAAKSASAAIKCGMAVLVVSRAFLRVIENFVGLAQFFEAFFRCLVARIFIRMKFDGKFSVGLLYFLFVCVPLHPKNVVIIAFGHGLVERAAQVTGALATTTVAGRNSRSRNLYPLRNC